MSGLGAEMAAPGGGVPAVAVAAPKEVPPVSSAASRDPAHAAPKTPPESNPVLEHGALRLRGFLRQAREVGCERTGFN